MRNWSETFAPRWGFLPAVAHSTKTELPNRRPCETGLGCVAVLVSDISHIRRNAEETPSDYTVPEINFLGPQAQTRKPSLCHTSPSNPLGPKHKEWWSSPPRLRQLPDFPPPCPSHLQGASAFGASACFRALGVFRPSWAGPQLVNKSTYELMVLPRSSSKRRSQKSPPTGQPSITPVASAPQ